MGKGRISRRNFLKSASIAGGTLATPVAVAGADKRVAPDCGSIWERPPKQEGNNLNLILIVADTFRRDNLECYGSKWVECPNLNRFSKDCIIFEDFYPEGLPTVVVRRNLYTGRRVLPTHYYRQNEPVQLPGWHPLYNEDVTLSETLVEAGYIPALICDVPHLQRPGRNFHRGYHYFEWIRGQENDYYGTAPRKPFDLSDIAPDDYLDKVHNLREFLTQYKANRNRWKLQGESLVQAVADSATRWLSANAGKKPFFLHVEAFDPHEPWDPPLRFLNKYLPNPKPPSWIQPPYADVKLPEEAKKRLRANYAAEATCVDFWLGKILETIDQLGLFSNSIVVFLSDHGALLGEQDQFVKGPEKLRGQVTHIPMLIRMPGKKFAGKRVSGFVQMPDVMPTLLGLLGLKPPPRVTGKNFWPLVTGEASSIRDHAFQGYGWIASVRSPEWNFSQVWKAEAYSGVYPPQLYNLQEDPEELVNVAAKHPDVVKRLSATLKDYLAAGEPLTRGSFNEKESFHEGTAYVKDSG